MPAVELTQRDLRVWEMTFTAWPASVGLARRQVRSVLCGWGWASGRAEDLVTICSELVTNAIVHASDPGGDVRVRLQEIDGDCRLEVIDLRPDLLPPRQPVARGENGRGLLLVRNLADDMDVVAAKEIKRVWARVLLDGGQPGVAA